MVKLFSYKNRPVHLGSFPSERLRRTSLPGRDDGKKRAARPALPGSEPSGMLSKEARRYLEAYEQLRQGEVAVERAPIPDDPAQVAHDLKSACYFLDASIVAVCEIPDSAWYDDVPAERSKHTHALVILVEHGREPEADNLASAWVGDGAGDRTAMRCAEIAVILAGYVRNLGWSARAHTRDESDLDQNALALRAGLARGGGKTISNPYLGRNFGLAVVTTGLPIEPDRPLARKRAPEKGLRYFLGVGGTTSGLERWLQRRRATHLSRYPMEKIKRVPQTTTLIFEDEVPRVPKRAEFFQRAMHGDLGDKAKRERQRFAWKHPFANAMTPLFPAIVRMQDGEVAPEQPSEAQDPEANAKAIKSLAYHLGADLVGICEAKPFTWYSHNSDGSPMEVKHKYAIVMLFDQGHETMEGASGDDWISGAQSMRAYMRGGEIGGIIASQLRSMGYASRSQTAFDGDVLQIPLILMAGLGELSRIGELVLNPFVGPRFKSSVVTTDFPMAVDQPIDFGLQDQCDKCMKCARECPCSAISFGDKVIFNGYEMWKQDVERCARYRVTNPHGSACGRCMKMCPYTNEGLLIHRTVLWLTIKFPPIRRWIPKLDDWARNGSRNPVKRWWRDLEWVDGRALEPKGTNERDLQLEKGNKRKANHEIAYYPAHVMPPGNQMDPVAVDRKAAIKMVELIESPREALERRRRGEPTPPHYIATPPLSEEEAAAQRETVAAGHPATRQR